MDKGEFAYRKNLENARAALARRQELDSGTSQFKSDTAAETLAATKQGLMRPKARPEEPVSGGMAEGMGMALMESFAKRDKAKRADAERSTTGAMTEETYAPTISPRPNLRDGDDIYQGFIDRGLPAHIAEGFVMNMRDESGLNPAINEANPLVPGSRGGFGLYQLTGQRRVDYESFAASKGVKFEDKDAQMDFAVYELENSESAAAKKIFATTTAGEAGAAIVTSFLRPSEKHRARRAAKYRSYD